MKKIRIKIISVIMVIAIFIPASLFVSADSLYGNDLSDNKDIVSEITTCNPLGSGEIKNETTTTVYGNNITETSVLVVTTPKGRASGTREAKHTKYVRRSTDKALVASFTLKASWSYNSTKGTVTRKSYSSGKEAGEGYKISTFNVLTDEGPGGLWWNPWSNVKGNYYVYLKAVPMSYWDGTVEIKCDSKGNVSTID